MEAGSDKLISRNPPADVQRQLRKEVGFGCPLEYCREPFLSFHHFDPPWCEENHHRVDGMIALCVKHHEMADGGVFDKARLHKLKKSHHSTSDVKARFEWARSRQLLRLGGFYTTSAGKFLLDSNNPFPAVSVSENEDGLMELSFVLQDEKGTRLAEVNRNAFQAYPPKLHDIQVNAGGTKVTIKVRKSEVVLELFLKRVSIEQLNGMMKDDWERWARFRDKAAKANPFFRNYQAIYDPAVSPELRLLGGQADLTSLPIVLPSDQESIDYRDKTSDLIRKFALMHMMQDDGKINILDFNRLITYNQNQRHEIRNGLSCGQSGLGFGCILARWGAAESDQAETQSHKS